MSTPPQVCLYGYSLAIYVPVSLLWLIQVLPVPMPVAMTMPTTNGPP